MKPLSPFNNINLRLTGSENLFVKKKNTCKNETKDLLAISKARNLQRIIRQTDNAQTYNFNNRFEKDRVKLEFGVAV